MAWDDDLLPEQRTAASYEGTHARLLAGPGTGKTLSLTRRICYLIENRHVEPERIMALTFTRAAAYVLRQRVTEELGQDRIPRISTIHSFSLRQLLRNSRLITALPQPLRIADDWEERNIITEDLKAMLGLARIEDIRHLFNLLSADWQTLTAEEEHWEDRFANPAFLGAWREHRECYGYVLRSELVYQLKRALEQYGDFQLETPLQYLLVDEYQDLNRCDLAVVAAIGNRGTEVYVAGDDDQSIYGFRKAHPAGIRRFIIDYHGARDMTLSICKRCDRDILNIGLFVARQDYERIDKPIHPEEGRGTGEVALLRFRDQIAEAGAITEICRHLLDRHGLQAHEILILLRSDNKGMLSTVIRDHLESAGIPVAPTTAENDPLNEFSGRQVLAILRMIANPVDHLAWRTLLQLRSNLIGPASIQTLYRLANTQGFRFSQAVQRVTEDTSLMASPYGRRVQHEVEEIQSILGDLDGEEIVTVGTDAVRSTIEAVVNRIVEGEDDRQRVPEELNRLIELLEPISVADFVRGIEVSSESIEQEIEIDKVNILTMHKAKGLTAEAVIVMAAEDEYIPGRAEGEEIGDERRLLYVSLTRARHYLSITYCDRRTGRQRHTGRTSGNQRRTLTRFLQDAPIRPQGGIEYITQLLREGT
jgi:DNA helicase-2/ATP-dependent DNA helicase PcrA